MRPPMLTIATETIATVVSFALWLAVKVLT